MFKHCVLESVLGNFHCTAILLSQLGHDKLNSVSLVPTVQHDFLCLIERYAFIGSVRRSFEFFDLTGKKAFELFETKMETFLNLVS